MEGSGAPPAAPPSGGEGLWSPAGSLGEGGGEVTALEYVRERLIREEDSIVFALVERAKFPQNGGDYESWLEFFVRQSEEIFAKVGRYLNPEEVPFYPENLPEPLIRPKFNEFLHPAAASVNMSHEIFKIYVGELTKLVAREGDDGDYGSTVGSDLVCLQALSRRIHFGRFMAEVKFRESPEDYIPLIKAKDRKGLMELLTFADVEAAVKRRVAKKAMIFGQDVELDEKTRGARVEPKYKVDPEVAARIYGEWVIPLTKTVQVEYLLKRLSSAASSLNHRFS
ncbi:chorismate mutase 2 [Wolffia australiana]